MKKRQGKNLFAGWQVFDNELCEMAVRDPALKANLAALKTEQYHNEIEDIICQVIGGESSQLAITKKVLACVRSLAAAGKAIIVGRGGVCATRDLDLGIHVRLVAPLDARIKYLIKLEGMDDAQAKKAVEERGRDRAHFMRSFFGQDIEDPLLFDVVRNTSRASLSLVAGSIVDMVQSKVQ